MKPSTDHTGPAPAARGAGTQREITETAEEDAGSRGCCPTRWGWYGLRTSASRTWA
jgi:hypothetical protein